ncbi:MAG: phospholipase [Candidatus Nanopelagicales bacterium]
MSTRRKVIIIVLCVLGVLLVAGVAVILLIRSSVESSRDQMYDGRLVDADYWDTEPKILSAGLGFDGIISTPANDEQTTVDAGGAWDSVLQCANDGGPTDGDQSSLATASGVRMSALYEDGASIEYVDGLPVVFSWPIRTDTLRPSQFRFTLNTGEVVDVTVATMMPNFELNERNTVVMFDELGNRGLPGEPDARYPVRLDIVPARDGTDLMLAGPDGDVPATGLSFEKDSTPYLSGPTLVGAKLNRIDGTPQGEGPVGTFGGSSMPNDEKTLFGDDGDFRLRMLTSGGFSPDGVRGVLPTDFTTFFRLHATGPDGEDIVIDTVGQDVAVKGGTLRIVGISDLGQPESSDTGVTYDDCYADDRDNYLDIILAGDEAAVRSITDLEIPALDGDYAAFYNPGGPGQTPTPGVRYTAPGPATMQPVTIALDDPMRVSRG